MHDTLRQIAVRTARASTAAAAVAALALGLGGCGGDTDAAAPKDSPGTDRTSSAPTAPETTPAAQQEHDAAAVPDEFFAAVERAYKTRSAEPLAETTTPEWAANVVEDYRTNIVKKGNIVLGRSTADADTADVEIDGSSATVDICVDNTQAFIVPAGTKRVGVGAHAGPQVLQTFTLELQDGSWLVSRITSEGQPC